MEVILLERIERLGQMGDVVRVKPGFARNFLLPQKKALRATPDNLANFETQRGQLEAVNLERRTEAEAVAEKLDRFEVVMIRQAGESGQLYGSVTTRDLVDALAEAGFTLRRSQVHLDRPIKALGIYNVRVALHPEVPAAVIINIAKTDEEAVAQIQAVAAEAKAAGTTPPDVPAAAKEEPASPDESPATDAEAPATGDTD